MISDDDTFDDYSVEFDDEPSVNEVSKTVNETSVTRDTIEKDKKKKTEVGNKKRHICRICLKRCNRKSKNASEFAFIYLKCTGFTFDDGHSPKKLCHVCMNELLKVENFIDKCSETEDKLSKGLEILTKNIEVASEDEVFSEISDVEVVIEGEDESEGTKLSDTIVKKMKVTQRKVKLKPHKKPVKLKVEKPKEIKVVAKTPKREGRGRPPLDPSEMKSNHEKRILQSKMKQKDEFRVIKPIGRPKNSFKEKCVDVKIENGIQKTQDRQICFVCGKLVRNKQISYHLWKHRKDQEIKPTEITSPTCEFCNKVYKTEEHKKSHMKRIHPAVAYGMPSVRNESPEPDMNNDNFEKEFYVPPKEMEYPQIQSPYTHIKALHYLQVGMKR